MSLEVVGGARASSYLIRLSRMARADVALARWNGNEGPPELITHSRGSQDPWWCYTRRQILLQWWKQQPRSSIS